MKRKEKYTPHVFKNIHLKPPQHISLLTKYIYQETKNIKGRKEKYPLTIYILNNIYIYIYSKRPREGNVKKRKESTHHTCLQIYTKNHNSTYHILGDQ